MHTSHILDCYEIYQSHCFLCSDIVSVKLVCCIISSNRIGSDQDSEFVSVRVQRLSAPCYTVVVSSLFHQLTRSEKK